MMILLRVSLFFLLLLLLPDWYIYKVYVRSAKHIWKKRLYWLPTVLLLLTLAGFIISQDTFHNLFGIYLVIVLCIAVPKLLFALTSILTRLLPGRQKPWTTLKQGFCLLTASAAMAYLMFGAIKGKEHFRVKEVTFSSSLLPDSFDGYRILQLSDIHSGSWHGNTQALRRAVTLCNARHPDLVVFTGDLVNSNANEVKPFIPVLGQLKAHDGVFSVLGNHDYATYAHWDSETERLANIDSLLTYQRTMGWIPLMNDHVILHRGNDSIALVGVENSGNPPFPNQGNLPQAIKGTEGLFKVLLSHDPTHWRREVLPETDIQLMLAGHTHDMQVSLFGFSVSKFIYPEHRGMYLSDRRGLYVNIGLGFVLFPMRLGAWPEITVITLKKEQQ